jgi:hypothetical protein
MLTAHHGLASHSHVLLNTCTQHLHMLLCDFSLAPALWQWLHTPLYRPVEHSVVNLVQARLHVSSGARKPSNTLECLRLPD